MGSSGIVNVGTNATLELECQPDLEAGQPDLYGMGTNDSAGALYVVQRQ